MLAFCVLKDTEVKILPNLRVNVASSVSPPAGPQAGAAIGGEAP